MTAITRTPPAYATATLHQAAALTFAQHRARLGRYVNPDDLAADGAFRAAIDEAARITAGADREPASVIAMRDAEIRDLYAQLAAVRGLLARRTATDTREGS